jgi:hypothetical protein
MSSFKPITFREYVFSNVYREMEDLQEVWADFWRKYHWHLNGGEYYACELCLEEMQQIDNEAAEMIEKIEAYEAEQESA